MGKREDELNTKALEQMHKDIYNAAHPRAQQPVEAEEVVESPPIDELPEVQPVPEPEPNGEEEAVFAVDTIEHQDKPPPVPPASDLAIKLDIVERIANPPPDRLIEMSEIPDAMVIPITLQIVQLAAADLSRTKPLGQVLVETYAIVMRARNRKLIVDLYKLFQTQIDKETNIPENLDLKR